MNFQCQYAWTYKLKDNESVLCFSFIQIADKLPSEKKYEFGNTWISERKG